MSITEQIKTLSDSELEEFSKRLFDDKVGFDAVIAELFKSDDVADYELGATVLSYAPIDGQTVDVYSRQMPMGIRYYFDMFLTACKRERVPERLYIRPMLYAENSSKLSALSGFTECADEYISERAKSDFELIADYIDEYDSKFAKYRLLLRVDFSRAVYRLLNKALFCKNIDKTAVRDILMDSPEIADELMELYGSGDAKSRAAITRLLLLYKNTPAVKDFLDGVVSVDKSKTVRDLLNVKPRAYEKSATAFFERLISSNEGVPYSELKTLIKSKRKTDGSKLTYADVADKLLFGVEKNGEVVVLACDCGKFITSDGKAANLKSGDIVYVLHPLDSAENMRYLRESGISQPVLQAARPVYTPHGGELYDSDRLLGTMLSLEQFERNFKKLGFVFSGERSDGNPVAVKTAGEYCVCVRCEISEADKAVTCGLFCIKKACDAVKNNRALYVESAPSQNIRSVPPKAYSELAYFVYKLFGVEQIVY